MINSENFDKEEIEKFNAMASRWWDTNGDFKALHDINPARVDYILQKSSVTQGSALDVGCGGGILTESLLKLSSTIIGIDAAPKPIKVAQLHAAESKLKIDYRQTTAEALSLELPGSFDVVTCMEMLEHVKDFYSTILACANLASPGADLFFSTINRNPFSFLKLIIGAEEILNILPKGTHHYSKFIKPSEVAAALRKADLELLDLSGISYNPFSRKCRINQNISTNYIVHARKPRVS